MKQKLKIRGGTETTRDFLSPRYKKLLKDREDVLKNVRRSKRTIFRQKIDNILKRL